MEIAEIPKNVSSKSAGKIDKEKSNRTNEEAIIFEFLYKYAE